MGTPYTNNRSYKRRKSSQYVKKVAGNRPCFMCGSDEDVTIHHEDGDIENNNLGNLVVLCRSCHDKEHGIEKKN